MTVTVAKNAGFCFGVKRATDCVDELINNAAPGVRIYTLGHLIHNRIYNETLAARGVLSISNDEIERIAAESDATTETILVLRTHGISKQIEEKIRSLCERYPKFSYLDMTCPFVKRIHNIAEENTSDDSYFVLIGSAEHPEVQGIMSYVRGENLVVSDEDALDQHLQNQDFSPKQVILAAQTTQKLSAWKKCQKKIKKYCTNAKIFDTICNVTEMRQSEVETLSNDCDLMIVVGGRDSSNTQKLYELCLKNCSRTIWIESASDLPLNGVRAAHIGIVAGASTPRDIITEVYMAINNAQSENFAEMLEESLKSLHTGETVNGIVTAISDKEIYLDVGAKVTGVIPFEQITDDTTQKLSELFKVGDEITAFVIRVDDGKGVATLSKKRIDQDKGWFELVELYNSGAVVEGTVTEAVKGGVLIKLSCGTVFIPASHTGVPKGGDLSTLVGSTQRVKIIDINETKKRALASIRVILSEERRAKEEAFWSTLEVGQHFLGKVKNLTNYGAFVDLGSGVDGMVHNTELSWKRIKHPSQVVAVGQEIDVFIKDLDVENKRISLGYKTQEMDTWYQFTQKFSVGEIVDAKIVSMMPFGAFAEVYDGVDGLIHISRISQEKIEKPEDVLSLGQIVKVKITEIDDDNRRLSLSIRALLDEAQRAAEKAEREAAEKAEAEERAQLEAEMAPYIVKTID
ncbi:MAG: bifunctional 4-hydroxy-3-methylbut-2-enyl diphosphate reductase/30S ribosomal protein S1 [Clostridia bacterium]|nr:bifunctional 4-hydroxy-3-methylbut-2-enyl diphosphate reductase/30S ribosomal protein S1 [Clostridia bacterium]